MTKVVLELIIPGRVNFRAEWLRLQIQTAVKPHFVRGWENLRYNGENSHLTERDSTEC
jgi:hypothetical protein